MISAVFFGSIGTIAETSEIQRRAFNKAFSDAGLDWNWTPDVYHDLLKKPGGLDRIIRYSEMTGEAVLAEELYDAKVANFQEAVRRDGLQLRDGVRDVISTAKSLGIPVGFATTTSQTQIDLIFEGLGGALTKEDFSYIGSASKVQNSKPAPDIYLDGLQALGVLASEAIAIEDTPESAEASIAAGIKTIGFAGPEAEGREFPAGVTHDRPLSSALIRDAELT